jgi:hypothetical protein
MASKSPVRGDVWFIKVYHNPRLTEYKERRCIILKEDSKGNYIIVPVFTHPGASVNSIANNCDGILFRLPEYEKCFEKMPLKNQSIACVCKTFTVERILVLRYIGYCPAIAEVEAKVRVLRPGLI